MKTRFLIIGAGPTGLGAAYRLKELGIRDFLVVEAGDGPGGLARSFRDAQGFVWDIGGHVQFSHYPYFDEVMLKAIPAEGWWHHQRESWVWIRNTFVPYPFQNNLRFLPKKELWECLEGILAIHQSSLKKVPANFLEWIHSIFGVAVARLFMEPYNFKVWATPLEKMSYQWIGERVSVTDLKRVLKNIVFELDDVAWGPNNKFQFPKHGGTGAIWNAVANLVGSDFIRLNTTVTRMDLKGKKAYLSTGECVEYSACLSTMPLDRFVQLDVLVPSQIRDRAKTLKHSSSNIVGVGVQASLPATLSKKCWMYFPEDNCPFYRATVFSHYSPSNVPDPETQYSLMLEVSESEYKKVNPATFEKDVVQGLLNTRLIGDEKNIVSLWSYRAPYGYPVPTLERDAILNDVIPYLQTYEVYSRGRFGGWKYEVSNQDHSMMQGVEWADRILFGKHEPTYLGPKPVDQNTREVAQMAATA